MSSDHASPILQMNFVENRASSEASPLPRLLPFPLPSSSSNSPRGTPARSEGSYEGLPDSRDIADYGELRGNPMSTQPREKDWTAADHIGGGDAGAVASSLSSLTLLLSFTRSLLHSRPPPPSMTHLQEISADSPSSTKIGNEGDGIGLEGIENSLLTASPPPRGRLGGKRISCLAIFFRHRLLRLLWTFLSIGTSTSIVYAWQPFSAMLFAEGVKRCLCTPAQLESYRLRLQVDPSARFEAACGEQDQAIQALYTYNMACEFIAGTVAGILLDTVGPALTGLTGQVLLFAGILSVALAQYDCSAAYAAGVICMGGACNFIIFPALAIADCFPGREGLIVSILLAGQNGSTAVTSILDAVYRGVNGFPSESTGGGHHKATLEAAAQSSKLAVDRAPLRLLRTSSILTALGAGLEKILTPASSEASEASRSVYKLRLRSLMLYYAAILFPIAICYCLALPYKRRAFPLPEVDQKAHQAATSDPTSGSIGVALISPPSSPKQPGAKESSHDEETGRGRSAHPIHERKYTLWQSVCTVELVLIVIFTLMTTLQFNYYPVILRNIAGDDVARFNGYFLPTQIVWTILFGTLVDRTGTLPICYVLMALIAVVYGLCLVDNHSVQYLNTIIFVIAAAYIYTVKFTYVQQTFVARYHGTLLSLMSLTGGLTLLANIPIRSVQNYRIVCVCMLGSVVVTTMLVGVLHYRRKVKHILYLEAPCSSACEADAPASTEVTAPSLESQPAALQNGFTSSCSPDASMRNSPSLELRSSH